ncbi:restriction endonuclease subunit S [Acetobacter sp.]|uniref:restriction endonuclease subunit S n=1 Tax=Acetobacter sp. TaxID=440 RepID=UPI0039EC6708
MSFPKYPAYKDSEVEWIGEVPTGWEVKSLRFALSDIFNGSTATQVEPSDDTVAVTRIETISSGQINLEKVGYINKAESEERKILKNGDIIFSNINSLKMIGNCAIFYGDFLLHSGMNLITLRPNSSVYPKFILYVLKSTLCREEIESRAKPAINQASISQQSICGIKIPDIPLPEQQAIASFLDRECGKIDALIAEQERLIALLAEKRQAVISHAVTKGLNPNAPMKDSGIPWIGMVPEGWKVVKLKHIGRFFGGAGFPHEFQGNENLELGFYKVGDLSRSTDGVFMSLAQHTVTYETAEQLKANVIPRNSILYAKIGAALLLNRRRISPDKCCIDNNMTAFIPNIPVHVKWSFWWLSFIDFSRFVKPGTVPSLSEGDQKEIAALLPPDRELDSIIEYIEANVNRIDLLEKEISRGIFISKERRAALISAAVTGKIDVRAQSKALAA